MDRGALAHRDSSLFARAWGHPWQLLSPGARCCPPCVSAFIFPTPRRSLLAGVWDRVAPVWTDMSASASPGLAEHMDRETTVPVATRPSPRGWCQGTWFKGQGTGHHLETTNDQHDFN